MNTAPQTAGMTVLVADDDDGYRIPIKWCLEDHGFTVIEATTREEVIARGPGAQIWVVDVRLPTAAMEGIQAVRSLLETGSRPHYVVFISVYAQENVTERLSIPGWVHNDFLMKPFELQDLLERLTG
jgi:CheY-like chemotaxis protein